MGSSGKKRTTMAKLNRESKLRDKRADKEARKTARKLAATGWDSVPEPGGEEPDTAPVGTDAGDDAVSDEAARTPAVRASEHSDVSE